MVRGMEEKAQGDGEMNSYNSLALSLLGLDDMFSSLEELQKEIWGEDVMQMYFAPRGFGKQQFMRRKNHTRRWNRWQVKRKS